jgi:hypothetical protein
MNGSISTGPLVADSCCSWTAVPPTPAPTPGLYFNVLTFSCGRLTFYGLTFIFVDVLTVWHFMALLLFFLEFYGVSLFLLMF